MEHGLLRLRLPKVAQARERRIQIQAGATPQIHEPRHVESHENDHDAAKDVAKETEAA
jgi:hypothetical protein